MGPPTPTTLAPMKTHSFPSADTAADLIEFGSCKAAAATVAGVRAVRSRAQNFLVEWAETSSDPGKLDTCSSDEMMVLVEAGEVRATTEGEAYRAGPASVLILTPGSWSLALAARTQCAILSSLREGVADNTVNAAGYEPRKRDLVGVGRPYWRDWFGQRAEVVQIAHVKASPDKPRIKMLQSATLSINWVEYDGPRDRAALSPHSHEDFEQGSLALAGQFVHHLRTEWGADADQWKGDVHALASSPSLLVVPPRTIHTSEGVGPGRHLLIDIFSPPREDFIANGWVYNAGNYSRVAA